MTAKLFLGYPISETYQKLLHAVDANLLQMVLREHELHEVTHLDVHYLGKWMGPLTDIKLLTLLESNIYSILQRLTPDHPCKAIPLELIAIK